MGELTARPIWHLEGGGLARFEKQFEVNRDAEAVAGPTLEGYGHDPKMSLSPATSGILVVRSQRHYGSGRAFDMRPAFFLVVSVS